MTRKLEPRTLEPRTLELERGRIRILKSILFGLVVTCLVCYPADSMRLFGARYVLAFASMGLLIVGAILAAVSTNATIRYKAPKHLADSAIGVLGGVFALLAPAILYWLGFIVP